MSGRAHVQKGTTAAISSSYFHREAEPEIGARVEERVSDEYVLERASLSSVLIARTVDLCVEPDNSRFGYRFTTPTPNKVRSLVQLKTWIEDEAHSALDQLVKDDPQSDRIAQRYEQLTVPLVASRPGARRATLSFQQAVSEHEAWIKTGFHAAGYHGQRLYSSQVPGLIATSLNEMQVTAKRGDVAIQDVGGAVLTGVDALGTMLTPEDPEAELRHAVLKAYVEASTGHKLPAPTFGDLYDFEIGDNAAVTVTRNTAGFGTIPPKRETSVTCSAAYRFGESPTGSPDTHSALFRLLRAGANSLVARERYAELLTGRRVAVEHACKVLNQNLAQEDKPQIAIR